MRSALIYISLFAFFGCKSIDKQEPYQTEAFLKFYGETNQTKACDLLVEEDGYLVLGTYSETASLLLKTDLQGNKLWAFSFDDFIAKSIVKVDNPSDPSNNGYIIIGDGIYNADTTYMKLIKTDFTGNTIGSDSVNIQPPSFGSAITYTSADQVVVMGYGNFFGNNYSSVVLMGYKADLTESWQTPRFFGVSNQDIVPSHSIFEANNGDIARLDFSLSTNNMNASFAPPDYDGPNAGSPLLNGYTIGAPVSDFVKTPVGFAVAQSITDNGSSKIGVSIFDQSPFDENVVNEGDFASGNYFPTAITNAPSGLIVAAYTDQHPGSSNSNRTDTDLLLLEVGYNGKPSPDGINTTFGGLGNEIPVRIRNASDGGYLILGTLENTKGAKQIFLLKTNSKGALN